MFTTQQSEKPIVYKESPVNIRIVEVSALVCMSRSVLLPDR